MKTVIRLQTEIDAPAALVFQLSRDIGLHQQSVSETGERAIAGTTSGLIGLGETVTFRAKHFGFWLQHTSKITQMDIPNAFTDELIAGHFKSFVHHHAVRQVGEHASMTDELLYETPFGWIGRLFDRWFLHRHLVRFLKQRNAFLKTTAEAFS